MSTRTKPQPHRLDLKDLGYCVGGDEHDFQHQSRRVEGSLEDRVVCVRCLGIVYDWDGPITDVYVGTGTECSTSYGKAHQGVREERLHPKHRDTAVRQDRLVCVGCGGTLYDWMSFRLNSKGKKIPVED